MKALRTSIYFTAVFFLCACAQVVLPTGGVKDTHPPKMLSSQPPNGSTDFNSKQILINFDEYLRLGNISEELTISPPIKEKPTIILKGKSILIKLKDSLKSNTTYSFNFGNAIKDVHEGNILDGFTYAVSTASTLDTLSAKGIVMDAFSHEPKEKITVMLYKNPYDSIPYKELPRYLCRTNKNGEFQFNYLKAGKYLLFVLDDKNRNNLFDLPNETIGFDKQIVDIKKDTAGLNLYTFLENKEKQYLEKQNYKKASLQLIFHKPTKSVTLNPINAHFNYRWYLLDKSKEGDTLNYYFLIPDSTAFKTKLVVDNKILDTLDLKINIKKELSPTLTLSKDLPNTKFNVSKKIVLKFASPIDSINKDKISVLSDSVQQEFNTEYTDSIHKEIQLDLKLKEEKTYEINVLPRAFIDIYNRTTDSLKTKFTTTEFKDYGQLEIKISLLDSTNKSPLILQLLNAQKKLLQQKKVTKSTAAFNHLEPGKYQLKVIFDSNGNNKWDTGDFILRKNPEKVVIYQKELQIRANWDKKVNWIIK